MQNRDNDGPNREIGSMSLTSKAHVPTIFSRLAMQMRVVQSLMIYQAQAKFSHETFGFFWLIIEPILLTCGVIVLWSATGRAEGHGDLKVYPFALTAYTHIQLWRHIVNGSIGSIKHNGWLFYHENIHVFDVFLSRTLMESVGIFASFVFVATFGMLFGFMDPPSDPGLMLAGWCLDTLFCLSFASVVAGLSEFSEITEKVLQPLMYLTLPLTGAFTMTSWLPPKARIVVEWSPLANACEMFRAGVFPPSIKTIWSVPFIVGSSLVLLLIGIPLMIRARKSISVQ